MSGTAPIAAFSTKAYFSTARTRQYCEVIAGAVHDRPSLASEAQLAVFPSFLAIPDAVRTLTGTGVRVGAQNVCELESGSRTGEVSIGDIRDAGCELVEIGHAERRTLYGETNEMIASKTRLTIAAGLIPLLCIGESERGTPEQVAELCLAQVADATGGATDATIWLGYEPYWAIGAPQPAPPEYVREVCTLMREQLGKLLPNAAILYGGAAGPGVAATLGHSIDGLFLGRFAHDPNSFLSVIAELSAR